MPESPLRTASLQVMNYKSYGATLSGFETIKLLNLIVGRNNAGKSALLDLLAYATNPVDISNHGHRGAAPTIRVSEPINSDDVQRAFPPNTSGGPIPGNHFEFGKAWIGGKLIWDLLPNQSGRFVAVEPPFPTDLVGNYGEAMLSGKRNPFAGLTIRRLAAEREVKPEPDDNNLEIDPSGNGLTTVIQMVINRASLNSQLVERDLLDALNGVTQPDVSFSRILVQQINGGKWEVFLDQSDGLRVPLSASGAGIKTVLLALTMMVVLPALMKKRPQEHVWAFEELENNLHPAIQRRLLSFIRDFVVKHNCHFFLTTHSSVAIDMLSHDADAQIIHVTHDGESAIAQRVQTYVDNRGILDDLDVRASDLLQANGIVWVEGPSDRLYVNRWIDIWSNGTLKEGTHYQCVFYGGRLLAHLSAELPGIEEEELMNILRVNRHAAILLDSDASDENTPLSSTKRRAIGEVEAAGGIAWVTEGRDIENYLNSSTIAGALGVDTPTPVPSFEPFEEYLARIDLGESRRFKKSKTVFAEKVLPHITKADITSSQDLAEHVAELCSAIRRWNRLPEGAD